MNKLQLLAYIFQGIEAQVEDENKVLAELGAEVTDIDSARSPVDEIPDKLFELASRSEYQLKLPPNTIPADRDEAVGLLREHYSDDVTRISLILSYYFPSEFVFYRVSKSESEILAGPDFLSEISPELEVPF